MNMPLSLEVEEFELDPEFEEEGDSYAELDGDGGTFETEFERSRGAGAGVQGNIERMRAAHAKLAQAVGAMGRHVTPSGGALRLRLRARNAPEAAARLKMDPRLFALLYGSLKRRNAQLQARARGKSELELEAEASSCPGRTEVSTRWWGIRIYLNECHTKALIDAINAGSGAAGVCAAVAPAPQAKVVCGVLAGLGGIGAAVISRIDSMGGNRGIVVSKPWLPTTPPIVWHQ